MPKILHYIFEKNIYFFCNLVSCQKILKLILFVLSSSSRLPLVQIGENSRNSGEATLGSGQSLVLLLLEVSDP